MSTEERVVGLEEVAVVVDPTDDLAVAKRDLPAGLRLRRNGDTLTLGGSVRAKHKFALAALRAGQPARMYGAYAGLVTAEIAPGEPVTLANLSDRMEGIARPAGSAPAQALLPPDPVPTFLGIDRGAGGVGTRNHLLVVYTVPCASGAAEQIAAACRRAFGYERGDRYSRYASERLGVTSGLGQASGPLVPGVDDLVVLHHQSGCGMPDHGDVEALMAWMAGYIRHPNVGGALVVSLGCEKSCLERFDPEYLEPIRQATGKPIRGLSHQAIGEEESLIRQGIDAVYELLHQIGGVSRTPVPLSRLVLGTKCGGSDGFSGLSANPALGWVSDRVAAGGGTVLLPEVPEMCGAEHVLASRATSPAVAQAVLDVVERYHRLAALSEVRLHENPSLGNLEDGILTIQMKSLGAIRKAGSGPVSGVLEYAEPAPGPGVYLLDSPGYDVLSTSALPPGGATLICFTTGLGTPFGNPIAPVVKVSSNTALARHMPDVIDFNAGTVIDGEESIEECGARLLAAILAAASGRATRNEENEHRESAFWQRQCDL